MAANREAGWWMNRWEHLTGICRESGMVLAYLFGSMQDTGLALLRGDTVKPPDGLADIDIGVIFAGSLPRGLSRARWYRRIYSRLEDLFLPYTVDLVLLQETHSVFQAEAVKGHCLYSADDAFRDRYEDDILRKACDFRPYLERYHQEVLEVYR